MSLGNVSEEVFIFFLDVLYIHYSLILYDHTANI